MWKNVASISSVLISVSLIGFVFFALVIVPKWKDYYFGQGVELPAFLILIIGVADLVVNYWYISFPFIAFVCYTSFKWI